MLPVTQTYYNLLPAKRRQKITSVEFNCPSCGDTRGRGSFLITDGGGFRYKCFNGGCDFEKATGYEDGAGLGGRPRKLFELLGGNLIDLPWTEILKQSEIEKKENKKPILEIASKFPEVVLPEHFVFIDEVQNKVRDYLNDRGDFYINSYPFMYSEKHKEHLIIPYFCGDKVVGWAGRHIYKNTGNRFIGPGKPSDYLFNQDIINNRSGKIVFVVEGEMDAIVLRGVASKGTKLTQKQINILNLSGKDIVIIPDRDNFKILLEIAKNNNWYVACPNWGDIKDVSQSAKIHGRLKTIEMVVNSITNNYLESQVFYNMNKWKKK